MGELVSRWAKASRRKDRAREDAVPPDERRALNALRSEAKERGATLATGGKGGLPSSLVLGVMRRDKYRCKRCGGVANLSLHHKGGIVRSKWLSKKGHSNDPNNIVTICEACHNSIHEDAREDGVDSSQVKPEGDRE